MEYYSTNHSTRNVSLCEAVVKGLAADRGLFMPERIPSLPNAFFRNIGNLSLQEISYAVANTLFGEDMDSSELKNIVYDTLNFEIPLVHVNGDIYSLELFHGPTAALRTLVLGLWHACLDISLAMTRAKERLTCLWLLPATLVVPLPTASLE